jgi:eukaryotic-like serine/threonine-protein kinase
MEQNDASESGRIIAERYEILRLAGQGAMGVVFACRDIQVAGRLVAVKVIPPEYLCERLVKGRLARELRTAHRVVHDNVVRFYDFIRYADFAGIVMEFVDGPSLRVFLEGDAKPPLPRVLDILRQICLGLGAIHGQGIVHRDLKPANILLADGLVVKISDFGIAKLMAEELPGESADLARLRQEAEEGKELTLRGEAPGTIPYMSPEALMGRGGDVRSDIYAVGQIGCELIMGGQLFPESLSLDELTVRKMYQDPPALQSARPDCPEELSRILMKAMARHSGQRYQSVAELAQALRQFAGSEAFKACAVSDAQRAVEATWILPRQGGFWARLKRPWLKLGDMGAPSAALWCGAAALVVLVLGLAAWSLLPAKSPLAPGAGNEDLKIPEGYRLITPRQPMAKKESPG